jgi:hypothetical protein
MVITLPLNETEFAKPRESENKKRIMRISTPENNCAMV